MRIKHSKYKNTGILFEVLVRQVTVDILDGVENPPSQRLLQKYFASGTNLAKELILYKTLLEEQNLSESRANHLIDAVIANRSRIPENGLGQEKYHLVREMKEHYPIQDLLKSNIPNYRVLASIFKVFRASTTLNESFDPRDVVQCRYTLVDHLTGATTSPTAEHDALLEAYEKEHEDLRLLAYQYMVNKFNERYSGLGPKQRHLLREYIYNISNTNRLREYINREVPILKAELSLLRGKIEDKVTQIKVDEAINQMEVLTEGSAVKDRQITSLLMYYSLCDEVRKLGEG